MTSTQATARSVVHDSFTLERTYPVAARRVFDAWAVAEQKLQWFGPDDEHDMTTDEHSIDFRVGGSERFVARTADGTTFGYDARYQDIVDGQRIVTSYEMTMDGRRISVSVMSVEFTGVAGGTRLVMTEQGAYLDGLDTNEQRRAGTEEMLDALGRHLDS